MRRLAQRALASFGRAARFYRSWARLVIVIGVAAALTALVSSGSASVVALLVAGGAAVGLIVYAGSRAFRAQQDLQTAEVAPPPEAGRARPMVAPAAEAADHTDERHGSLVTVVVTAHNDARFVTDCLASVAAQTWSRWECIVIDDASTDRTVDMISDLVADDPRFRILAIPDPGGVSSARNLGLSEANGDYITFLDADDFLFGESLERRALALDDLREKAGVVGVFSDWVGVPEAAVRSGEGRPAAPRRRIDWLSSADGAPLINSAPLLLTSEVRRIGGYRESWAEDADLWNRLLRHGYVLEPVLYNGIAYRQKASSRFRTTAADHAAAMTALVDGNRQPMQPADIVPGTPPVFAREVDWYRAPLGRLRRNLIALTTAACEDDTEAVGKLLAHIEDDWLDVAWTALDIEGEVKAAALRHEAYEEDGRSARAETVAASVMDGLRSTLDPFGWVAPDDVAAGPQRPDGFREVRVRERAELAAAALGEAVSSAVVLMPAVAYHVDEMGPLAEELRRRGRRVVFAISDRRWPDVEMALRPYDFPVVACPEPGAWMSQARAFVTLNDWGEVYRDVVVAAQEAGVPTFAKVEGVQDFGDEDVHWERRAYRTVDHVLCQGTNDASALAGQNTHVVGSSRLEAIWGRPIGERSSPMVVINSNFTYEVMSDVRDDWLAAAGDACASSGLPFVISMHPSERPYGGEHVAVEPMRHLLTGATALVSRFSTVPFEAMARGVPFIYFNPHGEKVPTFHDPVGAFDVASTGDELQRALGAAHPWTGDYRSRSWAFFEAQVSIDSEQTSAARAAGVIEAVAFE